jgi:catecholate siderophore receptor
VFVLSAGVVAAAALSPVVAAAQQQGPAIVGSPDSSRVSRYDINGGLLEAVLAQFERVTQITPVIVDEGLRALQSPGVSGNYTPEQAIAQLLVSMPIRATFDGSLVTLTVRPVNEFVEVSAGGPRPQSPKYGDALRDTPQTLVIIPQQVFQQQNASSLREVLRNTPGITMSIGEGATGTAPAAGDGVLIRGFSARNDIYIDGARDPGEVTRDMFNVEAVEVAKGPNSVVGGRGVTGGSINLVTKAASLQNASTIRMAGGSASHGRLTVDTNQRLTNSIALRLNAMWQDTGYPGRDVARYKSWGFAPSVGFGLGSPTQVTVAYSRTKQDNVPDWGIPSLMPDLAVAKGTTVNDVDFSNWYGLKSRDYEKTTSDIGTVTVDHRFNTTLSLRNLTRYGKNSRDSVITPPRPASTTALQGPEDPGYNPAVAQIRRTDTKYLRRDDTVATNQTDLTATFTTGTIHHGIDVGMEVARDHQPLVAFTDSFANGRPPVNDLFNPTPDAPYIPSYVNTGASSDAKATSVAGYAFDTLKFGSQWQADVGVRVDHIDIDYRTVSTTGVVANFGRTDKAVTGRTGVVYKPVESASLYATVGTSFNPSYDGGHGLQLAASGLNGQALAPERSRNIEGGIKIDLYRSLQVTGAVFAVRKTNAKTVDLTGATVLLGDQQVKGVEVGVSGNITDRWGAFAGAALMDGNVKASGQPSEVGAKMAWVPHATLNLWSTYRLPIDLTVGGGANYSDGHYFNQTDGYFFVSNRFDPRYVANAAAIQRLTKYWVFNAVAMYPVNSHIQLQLNLNNITNERYVDRAYDRHFMPGPTRQILFSPVISF